MHPSDKDQLKPLEAPPFRKNGFDKALQDRILRQAFLLDQEDAVHRSRRKLGIALTGGMAIAMMFAAFFILQLPSANKQLQSIPTEKTGSQGAAGAMNSLADSYNATFKSALLIGLRTDHGGDNEHYPYSEYRTVLVAPDSGQLHQITSGDGILMPYKMGFKEIATKSKTHSGKEVQVLSVSQASVQKKKTAEPSADQKKTVFPSKVTESPYSGDTLTSEKLTFAGNRYIAVEQQVTGELSTKGARSYVWVKHIEQLDADRSLDFSANTELHVPLSDFLPNTSNQGGLDNDLQWTVERKPGRWTAQFPEQSNLNAKIPVLPATMPKELISFDQLSTPWEEIWQRQPQAMDAYSSPAGETVAVVTGQKISFYLNTNSLAPQPALELPLKQGELIVMMQWATESYVERWKHEVADLLANPVKK
ncbi:hypothetical protein ACFOQM_05150 [Paenibacillus sp. GCM10012307]|uniref:Uncharacterized protein n=1 Tax=Paenibacillus roseus TaxID=2798579 RepID=A0A934IWP6_9BACL|nr:hypothetical protein [Paenibacillus roseus]MBJ6360692.1 hypothetical protein [Paenibacillus roseus]